VSDEAQALIADLVPDFSGPGKIGRPLIHPRWEIANSIMYMTATGCQRRALPACYPYGNTVGPYHLRWSNDGTGEKIVTVPESLLESRGPGPATVCESGRSWQRAGSVHGGRRDQGV